MGFAKVFSSILTSTIWAEDHVTVRVWIAMLASADAEGRVEGSIPGFAHVARVTIPELEKALEVLRSPDRWSRTPDHEGRRIEDIPGGWRLLNHAKYRATPEAGEGSRAPYFRDYRKRQKEKREAEAAHAAVERLAKRSLEELEEPRMTTTPEAYGQTVWDTWRELCDGPLTPTPAEHALIRKWEMADRVPLRVVLRAMKETDGARKAKSLTYMKDPVREAHERARKMVQA